jgi:hypothetical protein
MKTPLHTYLIIRHGGMSHAAKTLNLAVSTIHDWVHKNPRNALKYTRELAGTDPDETMHLVDAVYKQEQQLQAGTR